MGTMLRIGRCVKCGKSSSLTDKEKCQECHNRAEANSGINSRILEEVYSSIELYPPKEEDISPPTVVQIGKCVGCCDQTSHLVYNACPQCRAIFGQKCGMVFRQIRTDPKLATRIYNILDDKKKPLFVKLFGAPEQPKPGLRIV
jgi:hypothetical protein